MELKQYVTDAIRTESQITNITANKTNLIALLRMYVAIGNMIDNIKKNVFYGKPISQDVWLNLYQSAAFSAMEVQEEPLLDTETINIDPRLFHAIIGIATESTELVEAILIAIDNGTDIDHVNVREELGDLNWYQAIAIDASNADWDKILETNILKLKHRYPEKFTSQHAINRDLETERTILER